VVLVLPACASTERPEGLVERWLVSLNQGAAGRPEEYAADDLSEQILPSFRTADPGELDVIEVGTAAVDDSGLSARVRIHIERLDGTAIDAAARIDRLDGGDGRYIEALEPAGDAPALPSDGGPSIGTAEVPAWLAALGVAGVLIALTAGLMALVPERRAST
jgi:hypothetical protein